MRAVLDVKSGEPARPLIPPRNQSFFPHRLLNTKIATSNCKDLVHGNPNWH